MIYTAGNSIECTPDTPYLQIGEHKYGKPILDRAVTYDTDIYDALKIGLISMDSTMRSNLSVGLPIDIALLRRDALKTEVATRIGSNDPYFRDLRERWSKALREAHMAIPTPPYSGRNRDDCCARRRRGDCARGGDLARGRAGRLSDRNRLRPRRRCDAGRAIAKIYAAKDRPSFNPLIAHVVDLDAARREAALPSRRCGLPRSSGRGR